MFATVWLGAYYSFSQLPSIAKNDKNPKDDIQPPHFPANNSSKDILVLKPPSWRECFLGATWPVEPDHCHFCVQLPHISCNKIIVTTTMLLFSNSLFEKLWPILLANVQGWSTSLVWHARRWGVWQTCLMKKYKWEVLYSLTHSIFQHLVEKSMMNRPPLVLSDRWCRGSLCWRLSQKSATLTQPT